MTTYKRLEGSIIEEQDIGMEEKQEPIKNNHDVDQDDKKSITEEDIEEQKKSGAAEEEKIPVTEEDGGTDTVESKM